jgi:hypothetical protein
VWTQVPDDAYNNHNQREYIVGDFEYMVKNRIPFPVEDDWSIGGSLHHYDGSLDFHSGRRYYAEGSVTRPWDPEDWGVLHIPVLTDHEGHRLILNGEVIFDTDIGQRHTGDVYPKGTRNCGWSGLGRTTQQTSKYHQQSSIRRPTACQSQASAV